jgi:hypothetical protein
VCGCVYRVCRACVSDKRLLDRVTTTDRGATTGRTAVSCRPTWPSRPSCRRPWSPTTSVLPLSSLHLPPISQLTAHDRTRTLARRLRCGQHQRHGHSGSCQGRPGCRYHKPSSLVPSLRSVGAQDSPLRDRCSTPDVAIVVLGLNTSVESEGKDRMAITLPGMQDHLIKSIVATNTPTVRHDTTRTTRHNARTSLSFLPAPDRGDDARRRGGNRVD